MKVVLRQLGPGMMQQMQSVCPDCHGDGEMINEKDRCKFCQGRKVTKETKNHEIQIDKGMRDSQKITLRGEGDQTVGLSLGICFLILQFIKICFNYLYCCGIFYNSFSSYVKKSTKIVISFKRDLLFVHFISGYDNSFVLQRFVWERLLMADVLKWCYLDYNLFGLMLESLILIVF